MQHLVVAVAVDIAYAQLMELCRPGALVVAAPCGGVVPVGGCAVGPVVVPGEYIVVVGLVVVAIQTLHDERGVNAVEIGNGEVAVHGRIAVAHVAGTVGARVGVGTIVNLAVFQFAACNLSTCHAVDDRHVERTVAHRLLPVVHNAVAIYIRHGAAHCIQSPRLVLLVPKTSAVARLDDHLATPVAVDVVGHHHVVLSSADVHVGPHIDRPEQFTREPVSLYLVGSSSSVVALVLGIVAPCGACKQAVAQHGIHFTVAVKIHWPHKLRAVVVAGNDLVVEIELEPHVAPRLGGVAEGLRQRPFGAVGTDGSHGPLGVGGHRRGLIVGHLERCAVHLRKLARAACTAIYVVGGSLGLLCQFAPRH